jgi:hypothetical protein
MPGARAPQWMGVQWKKKDFYVTKFIMGSFMWEVDG